MPFLGIEPQPNKPTALHYQHPLSILDTNYLAFLTRKLGGWTFEELNVPLPVVQQFLAEGPDLSYDFFTRTELMHALLTGDAELLRQAYKSLLDSKLQPLRLVHDLQNHDEITYQLVGLNARGDDKVQYHGQQIAGRELREQILEEMRDKAAGSAAPYNLLYRPEKDGVATTYAGFVAAALGVRDLEKISPRQRDEIRRGHLLLAFANAMQPGVFSLSAWDLVGALPLPRSEVEERTADGDCRWINRGAVDLLGTNRDTKKSPFGLPRARALYGPLPEQLKDENSFAMQLKKMLAARKKQHLAQAELIAAPETKQPGTCVLIMRAENPPMVFVSALNFGRETVTEVVDLQAIKDLPGGELTGRSVRDCVDDSSAGTVDSTGRMSIELAGWSGRLLRVEDGTAEKAGGKQ